MAKRQTKRKVVIRYVGRNPDDPMALLDAIEYVFRPKDIEISVEMDASDEATNSPNEQLETKARERASKVLDERAEHSVEDNDPKAPDERPSQKRRTLLAWMTQKIAGGWKVFVKILPTLQKVKELFE